MFYRPVPQVPSMTAEELHTRLTNDPAESRPVVIDVREPEEWIEGHIDGATLIPLGDLSERIAEVPHDRDVVLVCHSGGRSNAATAALQQAGYANAINMLGGMDAWEGAQFPIETGA